jgi:hypothetical protein
MRGWRAVAARPRQVHHRACAGSSAGEAFAQEPAMPDLPSARVPEPAVDDETDDLPVDDNEAVDEDETPEEELVESGLDLSEASELDADNVLADEESARVVQAPD